MIDYRAGRTRAVAFRDGTTVEGEASAVTKPTFEEARDEFFSFPALDDHASRRARRKHESAFTAHPPSCSDRDSEDVGICACCIHSRLTLQLTSCIRSVAVADDLRSEERGSEGARDEVSV